MIEYPDNCIQSWVRGKWWEPDESKTICRGSLVQVYVQFFSQVPFQLSVKRVVDRGHDKAFVQIHPLFTKGKRPETASLPVAGFPHLEGADCFIANRAKRRPCLVLGALDQKSFDKTWESIIPKAAKSRYFLVAPYFSTDPDGRAGYPSDFIERVQQAVYPRFFWDTLPAEDGHASILRLDQIQPVGFHQQAFDPLGYRLSEEACGYVNEWFQWLVTGQETEVISSFKGILGIEQKEGGIDEDLHLL